MTLEEAIQKREKLLAEEREIPSESIPISFFGRFTVLSSRQRQFLSLCIII